MYDIKKAAVIGSGVMGGAIAAHLANAGIKVVLLDIIPNKLSDEEKEKGLTLDCEQVRNRIVMKAKERIEHKKSMMLYTKSSTHLIQYGNLEDDLDLLKEVDWVIEVIIEDINIKESLYKKVSPYIKEDALLSSNTSGISINEMSEVLPEKLKERFFGTHFFNPVRFMKLIEMIPSKYTNREALDYMTEFCENKLGKGVVIAKDTPGFIANRIGAVSTMIGIQKMNEFEMNFEEVDALTGTVIGRPKTGTFRLYDMVGIDTIVKLASYLKSHTSDEHEKGILTLPDYFNEIVEKGLIGDKAKQGFYKKIKKPKRETLTLDTSTFEYRPKKNVGFDLLSEVKKGKSLEKKLNTAVYSEDKAGEFVWNVVKESLLFVGKLIPEVADDVKAIDDAMKWGYNWEIGPFELWDMIGVNKSVGKMKAEGEKIPEFVAELLESGKEKFYEDKEFKLQNKKISPAMLLNKGNVVLKSDVGSLIDLEDDVAGFVLHSPNNTVNDEVIDSVYNALDEVKKNYKGMVFASSGNNFCVGANLQFVLNNAMEKKWGMLEKTVKDFQDMNMAIKYFDKPIVAAPFGMTLGGGAEITLHSSKVRAFAETYMGLVEIGVGILPAGGGTKELYLKLTENISDNKTIDLSPFIQKAFDLITTGKVSGSAPDAKQLGLLQNTDAIAMNKDYQLFKAKKDVLELADTFMPKNLHRQYRVGGEGAFTLLKYMAYQMCEGKFISEYDKHVVNKIAYVISGGEVMDNSFVSEQYLLDLELEAFMSLVGEKKTQERMEYMIKTGKTLRN
ncbi:3-hydroxyacyl-CoA dehydrogenase [Dethiosulfatibacter aminovorans DSM 17477]|uniref:3-hydroxyacyl-CoA dehydrogenase n=1 Tax=Dethiosulfatibacter aminovorans DSM 17477 TaxID=1121476 RepID=A0A1M6MBD6_9FIRM|nr:3-hydroxyacyl-CoA dehydrogenase/enoyl-CoA hydratase family protein [Dethiosulfatibacter aminovorans]SHJ80734.1 3-hydroxyacyl-CoA dehydrogenase [Dethiosulfatibacter aminovorans DSM 17477]